MRKAYPIALKNGIGGSIFRYSKERFLKRLKSDQKTG